jgi:N-acetylglutamate synthase-like GNAT family acetyltransferase
MSLYVNEKYRHKGYGTELVMKALIKSQKLNMNNVKLDDMSDIRGEENIYKKIGFHYVDIDSGPEMYGLVNKILN